jgi:hypothetical protein
VTASADISAESMVLFVPAELAPNEGVARTRAGIFATLAMRVGTAVVDSVEAVPGGWRVALREASIETAQARRR